MSIRELDLTELRATWEKRRNAGQRIRKRIDTRGMKRPARDPDEFESLAGEASAFQEDRAMAVAAREYYSRKYTR